MKTNPHKSNSDLKVTLVETATLNEVEYRKKKTSFDGEESIKKSLQKYGVKSPIVVNRRSNGNLYIVNGFIINSLWRELGNKTIRAIVLELTDREEQELHIYLNMFGRKMELSATLNFLEDLDPEDFDLKKFNDEDEKDDHNHLKKQKDRAEKLAKENAEKGITRWRLTYKTSTLKILKNKLSSIKKDLGVKDDHQVIEFLIMNYKK